MGNIGRHLKTLEENLRNGKKHEEVLKICEETEINRNKQEET